MRKIIFAICLLLSWPGMSLAQVPITAQTRETVDLSTGWRFHLGAIPVDPTDAAYDDSSWQQVSVPHSWNRIGEYADKRSAEANNVQGVGWYRLAYNAPSAPKGKRHYLDFAAVGAIADVWVNGVHLGQHRGAFGRFRFDVTAQWKPGAVNLIAVKADNSKPAVGSSTENVIPLAGDFFVHGGIYRGVSLITANDAGIDLLDMGGPGVYVTASEVAPASYSAEEGKSYPATGEVVTRLRNLGPARRRLTVSVSVSEAGAAPISAGRINVVRATVAVAANGTAEARQRFTLQYPRLWRGRTDPFLYTATSEVRDGARLIDRVTQTFGIRSFKFDPDRGFALNGEYLPLHGVSRHQDRAGQGWALTRADHKQDMDLIAEMGANSVRMAHYQHDDAWADEADSHGIVAWAEVPYVTTPSLNGGQGSPELWANAEQQLRELIRQMYNHPSIVMWSIGNETDAAAGFGASKEPVKPLALLQNLQKIAKQEDPSRATTFADCCEGVGMMATSGEMLAGTADLVGYNRYYGWYYPKPIEARVQLGKELDRLHAKHPTVPISVSEYGAGGAVSQHSDNVRAGFLNFMGRPQPEEFESFVHEENWPAIRDRKFVFASWVWNMFDFASDLRKEGDSVDLNTKGLVTYDRKTRKDAFYYYQAQWSDKPMVHIASARYVDRAYPVTDVRVYSNAPQVALNVNGVGLPAKTCEDRICAWHGLPLRSGPNVITASISVGSQSIADSVTWNGPDAAQGIRIDAGDLAARALDGMRFGSDSFVTGGEPKVLNMGGFGGRQPVIKTVAAPHPELYEYWREGEAFSYAIPVANGRWNVTVHSFEPRAAGTEAQTMTIAAQGRQVSPAFNIAKAAGGPLKGVTRTFAVTVRDGELKLDFAGVGGKAVVAAIEVTK